MLYSFYGTDVVSVRKKAHDFLAVYEQKGIEIVNVPPENYHEGMLVDFAGAASLFSTEQIVVLDTPSEKKEVFEDVFSHLALLGASPNTFILIEEVLHAPQKKKLEKHAEKNEELSIQKKERFNAFALTDALARRDKKSLWILLTQAWQNGLSNEEILGVLFWQIKTLRIVEKTKSARESGQKPFVYEKAKRALTTFKKGELDVLSQQLLTIYHNGHLGTRDLDIALEHWVLTM